ncbi:MAG: response regulator [Candidatus Deferrimicrobium sp.]
MSATILVVEDNEQIRVLLRDVLASKGYRMLLAADGAEGVRMAIEHSPDLVLMDIQMPVMNGIAAGKLLRADPRTKGIRMLALSGFLQLEDEGNFFRDGFDGHIAKPIDIRQLPAIVMKHLGTEEPR